MKKKTLKDVKKIKKHNETELGKPLNTFELSKIGNRNKGKIV